MATPHHHQQQQPVSVVTCGSLKGVCANGTGITTTKELNGLRLKQPFRSMVVVNGMAHKSSVMKG